MGMLVDCEYHYNIIFTRGEFIPNSDEFYGSHWDALYGHQLLGN